MRLVPAPLLAAALLFAGGCVELTAEREAGCEPFARHSLVAAGATSAPRFVSFAGSLAAADDSGRSVETFRAVLFDADGEDDFAGALLRLVVEGPDPRVAARVVARRALNETREPAFGADDLKVWSGERGDGALLVAARHAFATGAAPGNYTIALEITAPGEATVRSATDTTVVRPYATRAGAPVDEIPRATPPPLAPC